MLRISLFLLGLIYGTIINSSVIGICYGLFMIRRTVPTMSKIIKFIFSMGLPALFFIGGVIGFFAGIGQGLALSAFIKTMALNALGYIGAGMLLSIPATIIISAAVCLAVAVIGFTMGILYALTKGTWHCAMDFYNNGLMQGFTSPFRFISASRNDLVNHNRGPLLAYYESTDIGILEIRAIAERLFERRIAATKSMVTQISRQHSLAAKQLPGSLKNMITEYAVDPGKILLPDVKGSIARAIEKSVPSAELVPISKYLTPENRIRVLNNQLSFHRDRRPTVRANVNDDEIEQPSP